MRKNLITLIVILFSGGLFIKYYYLGKITGKPVAGQTYSYTVHAQEMSAIDSRVNRIEEFFARSVLRGQAKTFVEVADANGLDWRLLPAIAMVESTGARHVPSCAQHNPFGWSSSTSPCGFYRFGSYEEAIKYVGDKIGQGIFYRKFQESKQVYDLAVPYNENPGDWTEKVNWFINKI